MRSQLRRARRLVVKVGTSLLAPPSGGIRSRRFSDVAAAVAEVVDSGHEVILVSSGAVGLGTRRLGLRRRPEAIPAKQAAAAVGQIDLCQRYERAFARHGRRVGQLLLTHVGLADRERFLNARHTLQALLAQGVIPIVNENDSVATEELRFGDNDMLAALVVNASAADLLVLLTDVDGYYDRPPDEPGAQLVPELAEVTPSLLERTSPSRHGLTMGGMRTKLEAARTAGRFGVPSVIASGRRRDVLRAILAGDPVGTLIHASKHRLSSRKHWIAYSLRPRGTLELDGGAVRALRERGRSLLAVGVLAVEGDFGVGDPVSCRSSSWEEVARGLAAYSALEVSVIKGHPTRRISELLGYSNGDEVIHRDDLIVL